MSTPQTFGTAALPRIVRGLLHGHLPGPRPGVRRPALVHPRALAAAAALAGAAHAGAWAQDAAAPSTALTLGEVSVSSGGGAGPLATRQVLSSVDLLTAEAVADQHVDYSWELFTKAPGVQVTPFKQGTDAGRISFRGFNGEGRINAVKLLIDGIPSNDNAGGMPYLDAVFPLDIEAIEIVRGTNDPRRGLYAIAGSVDVLTRSGGNDGQASLTLGSFGTREVQLAKGIERGNWTQNYSLSWRDSDGWRDHADARKRGLSGKWTYTTDDQRWKLGASARWYRNRALESGYLTERQARETPRLSPAHARADRSERDLGQLAVFADGQLTDRLSWSGKAYLNRYENDRWVRFTEAGAQQERYNKETHYGLLSSLSWKPAADWARTLTLEGGAELQRQDNVNRRNRTVERVPVLALRDWDYTFNTLGAYAQAVWQPLRGLKLIPGYRVERLSGRFDDRLTGQSGHAHDYGVVRQPKFSALYAFNERASVYANWGKTFQVGVGRDSYRLSEARLAPSVNTGWEAGVKLRPLDGLELRLAYWQQRASDEVHTVLGVDGTSSDVANVGRTRRQGFDAQANWRVSPALAAWLAYSHQSAEIVEPPPGAPETRGKQVENVPRYLASAGLDWRPAPRWKLSAWASAQGGYHVETRNALGRFGQHVLLNLGGSYAWRPDIDLGLQVKNLADRRHVYAWYDSGSWGFAPGDGRAAYATVNWKF